MKFVESNCNHFTFHFRNNVLVVFKCSTFTCPCMYSGNEVQILYVWYCRWVEVETKQFSFESNC